jgi:hypothetical protein
MKTGKPTENELEMAIVAAEQMMQGGQDEHHLAGSLIYLYQRTQALETVLEAAKQLSRNGANEARLAELARAITTVETSQNRPETPG